MRQELGQDALIRFKAGLSAIVSHVRIDNRAEGVEVWVRDVSEHKNKD